MSGSGDLQPNSGLRYHTDADSPLPETINPIIDAVESHLADNAAHTDFKVGQFVRDKSLISDLVITVGFKPRIVMFFAVHVMSIGIDDGINPYVLYDNHHATPNSYQIGAYSIRLIDSSNNYMQGAIKSFNPDGFTLSFSKTGTPTGTANIFYMAIK